MLLMLKKSKLSEIFRKVLLYWAPPVVWGALIFSGSSTTAIQVSRVYWQDFVIHKTAHIIEYAILGILIYRALRQEKIGKIEAVVYSIVISAFYGMTDEFHQSFTPTRTPRVRDVIIDTIGASIGIIIVWKLLPKTHPKLMTWAEKLGLH